MTYKERETVKHASNPDKAIAKVYSGKPKEDEKLKKLLATLPPGYGPDHPDWNNPGKASFKYIYLMGSGVL